MLKASSLALAALLVVSTAACAVDIPDPPQGAPSAVVPTSAAPTLPEGESSIPEVDPTTTSPEEAPTPSDEPTGPDNPAGNGTLPATTFDKTLTYDDGSTVEVTEVAAEKLSARGVANDAKPGTPIVVVTLKVTNGSDTEIEVTGSSASMTYGPKRKLATEAFELGFESMQGTIAPGKSKSGSYGFVVPVKERGDVQMEFTWDFYSVHKPALFTGELPTG